jgi:hypothetical protein
MTRGNQRISLPVKILVLLFKLGLVGYILRGRYGKDYFTFERKSAKSFERFIRRRFKS